MRKAALFWLAECDAARDDIGHVAIGNRCYGWLCEQRGLEPDAAYAQLVSEYAVLAHQLPGTLKVDEVVRLGTPALKAV